MIDLYKIWNRIKTNKTFTRHIKEVNYKEINLNEYIIIDVRSRREYKEGHLNNSVNIPLYELKQNIEKYVKNKEKKLLVCCEYGVRSKKAAIFLEDMGYINVYNLKGGLENI